MTDKCGAVGEMTGRGNLSTGIKLSPVPLCPPQIPRDLTQARTRAAAVGSYQLTAWATARPVAVLTRMTAQEDTITREVWRRMRLLPSRNVWECDMYTYQRCTANICKVNPLPVHEVSYLTSMLFLRTYRQHRIFTNCVTHHYKFRSCSTHNTLIGTHL
jgi:hypothetical protein